MQRIICVVLVAFSTAFVGCEESAKPAAQLPVANADNCRPEWIKSAPWPDQMKRDHGAACARSGSFQFAPPKTY
jgi:entry exclusion lipoprotein TrbK